MDVKRAALWSALWVMLGFLLVLAVLGRRHQTPQSEAAPDPPAASQTDQILSDADTVLQLKDGQQIQQITLQDYLLGVLCCEMPLDFEPEALKAQAVASRTFVLYQMQGGKHSDCDVCADSACCQAFKSEQELEQMFADEWQAARQTAMDAISATDGQVLTMDGALINAVFFACSGGMTESAVEVWGGDVPYLQSVESPGEEIADAFFGETAVGKEEFAAALQAANPAVDLSGNAAAWFGDVSYSAGGGVVTMAIGGQSFTGTELRSLFGLNSTCFTVAVSSDSIVFQTRGKGHRVGMSQYGAQAMALAGDNYEQILLHYYTGVSLQQRLQDGQMADVS